jgi:STE24 endopeptidase
LGDTLLDHFSLEEIEVVFAHEIGHHVLCHMRKLILAGLAFSAVGFWACDRVLVAWVGRWEPALDYAAMPVYAFPLLMFFLTALRTVMEPLGHAISRRYERQADRYALMRTGLRDAFRSAFCKLARQNKDDPSPPRLEVLLFNSHPPIAERLALAGAQVPGDQSPP